MSKEKFRKKLGYILKEHRNRLGWSQEKLAEKMQISYQQVQKYEYGNSKLTCEKLLQFAKIFGVEPEAILLGARMDRQ